MLWNNCSAAAKSTEAAKQRLLTPAGWDQLNVWIKDGMKKKSWSNLQHLLVQCMDLPVTLELLKRNDTPKLIRKLSISCPNAGKNID